MHNFPPYMSPKNSENLHEFNGHFQPLSHSDYEFSYKLAAKNAYLFVGNCMGRHDFQSEMVL